MENPKIIVLSSGLTRLELYGRLKASGKNFILHKKESFIGGICRTNKTEEHNWDFAVRYVKLNKEIMDFFYSFICL